MLQHLVWTCMAVLVACTGLELDGVFLIFKERKKKLTERERFINSHIK